MRKKIDERVQKAVNYINQNYNKSISLRQLAREVSLSGYRLEHLLKEEIGIPFKKYLLAYRLQKARELLSDANLNVSEVAYSVGFNSVSNFTHYFKRRFKLTPSEFRRRVHKKKQVLTKDKQDLVTSFSSSY